MIKKLKNLNSHIELKLVEISKKENISAEEKNYRQITLRKFIEDIEINCPPIIDAIEEFSDTEFESQQSPIIILSKALKLLSNCWQLRNDHIRLIESSNRAINRIKELEHERSILAGRSAYFEYLKTHKEEYIGEIYKGRLETVNTGENYDVKSHRFATTEIHRTSNSVADNDDQREYYNALSSLSSINEALKFEEYQFYLDYTLTTEVADVKEKIKFKVEKIKELTEHYERNEVLNFEKRFSYILKSFEQDFYEGYYKTKQLISRMKVSYAEELTSITQNISEYNLFELISFLKEVRKLIEKRNSKSNALVFCTNLRELFPENSLAQQLLLEKAAVSVDLYSKVAELHGLTSNHKVQVMSVALTDKINDAERFSIKLSTDNTTDLTLNNSTIVHISPLLSFKSFDLNQRIQFQNLSNSNHLKFQLLETERDNELSNIEVRVLLKITSD